MASVKPLTKARLQKLESAVVAGFKEHKLKAKAELSDSGLPGRYRLFVFSPDFDLLTEAERQDMIWRILRDRWTRDDQVRLTLTLALTPKEAKGGI